MYGVLSVSLRVSAASTTEFYTFSVFSQPLSDLSSVFCYVPLSPESPRPDYPIYSELVLLLRAKGVECNVWVFPFFCKLPFSIQPVLTSGLVRMVLRGCVCFVCFCVFVFLCLCLCAFLCTMERAFCFVSWAVSRRVLGGNLEKTMWCNLLSGGEGVSIRF